MYGRSCGAAARRIGVAGACALLLVSCATNPVTGQSQFTLFTEAEEIELGLAADRETLPTFGEYLDDPALTAYVSDLGLRMAAQSERPELPWSFRVIDDETVNAFALPGVRIRRRPAGAPADRHCRAGDHPAPARRRALAGRRPRDPVAAQRPGAGRPDRAGAADQAGRAGALAPR